MRIQSDWCIKFFSGGRTVRMLEYGSMVDSEILWSLKKPLQVTLLDDSVSPYLRHGGNAVYNLSFKVYQPIANDDDINARKDLMTSLRLVAECQVGTLTVSTREDFYHTGGDWTFSRAYITDYSAVRDTESGDNILSFSVTATGLPFLYS